MEIKQIQWYCIRVILFLNMHGAKPWSKNFNCQKAYLSNKSEYSSSNLALVSMVSRCFGPSTMAITKGKLEKKMFFSVIMAKREINIKKEGIETGTYLIFVRVRDDSSIFAFSAVSVRRCRACLSFRWSMPSSFLKFLASQSTILY